MSNAQQVSEWRRRTKAKLVEHHGGQCVDCGYRGPAFMYEFDHRDPDNKSFSISGKGVTRAYSSLLTESLKCDLVCPNCHRMRTHKQRCLGCPGCNGH
jgi:hypothetical protein